MKANSLESTIWWAPSCSLNLMPDSLWPHKAPVINIHEVWLHQQKKSVWCKICMFLYGLDTQCDIFLGLDCGFLSCDTAFGCRWIHMFQRNRQTQSSGSKWVGWEYGQVTRKVAREGRENSHTGQQGFWVENEKNQQLKLALLRTTTQSPGKDIKSDIRQPFFAPQQIPSRNKNGLFKGPNVIITAGIYTKYQAEIWPATSDREREMKTSYGKAQVEVISQGQNTMPFSHSGIWLQVMWT